MLDYIWFQVHLSSLSKKTYASLCCQVLNDIDKVQSQARVVNYMYHTMGPIILTLFIWDQDGLAEPSLKLEHR